MSNENLKFKKPHMTNVDGYFYMFDDDTDMLLAKSDDGTTAFSYPFDTLLFSTVLSVEHDGINFWTLEVGTTVNTMVVRRWRIENYICKLKQTITLSSPYHKFISQAFTVEHYHCTISGSYSPSDRSITLSQDLPGSLNGGMTVSLISDSNSETIQVQNVTGRIITLTDPVTDSYDDGDTLLFYNFIWLFNDSDALEDTKGALYKISAYSGSVIQKFSSGAYRGITACTFYEVTHFSNIGPANSLMFIKASNLLFVNINSSTLDYYGSMAMDTINANEVDILIVYDIAVKNNNLYRLQKKATYFGITTSWSDYNYQPATFNSMVASISLEASPNVIAANQVSSSVLTAKVRDQFGQPVPARIVYFTDDDTDGIISSGGGGTNTNSNGEATAVYTSGLSARLVKITAKVNQT